MIAAIRRNRILRKLEQAADGSFMLVRSALMSTPKPLTVDAVIARIAQIRAETK